MKIQFENINYTYNAGYSNEVKALQDLCFTIEEPSFIALIGSTGSGKSTLIQLFNGLIRPESGAVLFDGQDMYQATDKTVLRDLRRRVGLVFQYPENQLFDETVLKDTAFGPLNQGLPENEASEKAKTALKTVGIREELFEKSPFELSGGEMRRVAIAGVLAMEPELLILDEPTAGLDPLGKSEILGCIRKLQQNTPGMTVIFVTHNMEEVAEYADRVIALHEGRIVFDGTVQDAFLKENAMEKIGLGAPEVTCLCEELGISGILTVEAAADAILRKYK